MATSFADLRRLDISGGFSAEDDPNTTEPPVADVFDVPSSIGGGQSSRDIEIYGFFDPAPTGAGKISMTLWGKDELEITGARWFAIQSFVDKDDDEDTRILLVPGPLKLFMQFTALTASTPATLLACRIRSI